MTDHDDWDAGTWDGARRAQLQRALQMTVRERLEVMEQLSETGRRIAEAGVHSDMGSSEKPKRVEEEGVAYQQDRHEVELRGCTPVPLGAYLKALGVLRLVAEQADPAVRGFWRGDHFVLTSRLNEAALVRFFAEDYEPTPILAPWNGGSGFYSGDNQTGIDAIRSSKSSRFRRIRESVVQLLALLEGLGVREKPSGEAKAEMISCIRADAEESLLAWVDSAVLLSGSDPRYPPLLGTGGNDGRLDFTNNFMQRITEVFDTETGAMDVSSFTHLRSALAGTPSAGLIAKKAIGQFMPGAAGGPNASSGFDRDSLINPWDYILMLEGAVLFAATATRRHTSMGEGQLSYPFTVRPTGSGSGSSSMADEQPARAEIWMPLWDRPLSLWELRTLLGEGRVTLGQRPARDGLDFARALAALGVERGITSFQRYGFMMRSGKAYLATPLNRIRVQRNPDAALIDQLERNDFLGRFRIFGRSDGASAAIRQLARRLEDAAFDLSAGSNATAQQQPGRVQRLLEVLGDVILFLAVSRKSREACPRLPWLDADWVLSANDSSVEFRIASALAGSGTREWRLLHHIVPVEHQDETQRRETSSDAVWGHGSLESNLARVLARRLLVSDHAQLVEKPFGGHPAVDTDAIARFLARETDDVRVAKLTCGLALVRNMPAHLPHQRSELPLPAAYTCLKLLFTPLAQLRRLGILEEGQGLPLPRAVPRLLMAGRPQAALDAALHRLKASRVVTGQHGVSAEGVDGPRLLAALMLPVSDAALRSRYDKLKRPSNADSSRATA